MFKEQTFFGGTELYESKTAALTRRKVDHNLTCLNLSVLSEHRSQGIVVGFLRQIIYEQIEVRWYTLKLHLRLSRNTLANGVSTPPVVGCLLLTPMLTMLFDVV